MKTYIAPLLKSSGDPIEKETPSGSRSIYWFDELFADELQPSAQEEKPLIILLEGPPGSGKSLLAQQICYNVGLACARPKPGTAKPGIVESTSLIITTETSAAVIKENLKKLGLYDRTVLDRLMFVEEAYLPRGPRPAVGPPPAASLVTQFKEQWLEVRKRIAKLPEVPHIVVVDSLNVLETRAEQADLFQALVDLFQPGPAYLFLVLDTAMTGTGMKAEHAFWQYLADVCIRMDYYDGLDKYFMRQMEVVKTRQQEHRLGKFLAKIYAKPDVVPKALAIDPEGARPHITTGGVFVFPSLHYVLSRVRTGRPLIKGVPSLPGLQWAAPAPLLPAAGGAAPLRAPEAYGPGRIAPPIGASPVPTGVVNWIKDRFATLNWPVPYCFELVGGGVPLNQCTALVGRRGARKSYFGYQFLLDGIVNGESTMVVSFRDNPESIRQTLDRIRPHYGSALRSGAYPFIIYQRPGYVAPDELLHRVITAVGEHAPTRVLINAIDQWQAAYPLLAASRITVPAMIDFLNSQRVTSMIVGVGEDKAALGSCGLTAKAEVVLSFEYQRLAWPPKGERASLGLVEDAYPKDVPLSTPPTSLTETQPKVVVRADRVPRGGAGFGRAVLENTYDKKGGVTLAGLTMTPLAPEYPEGTPI